MSASPPAVDPAASGPAETPERVIERLQAACDAAPTAIEPRLALARSLLFARRPAEAVFPAEQAVALSSGAAAAVAVRDQVMAALQAGDPDLVRLALTCALNPGDGAAQLALGEAYAAHDRPMDAERHLKQALRLGFAREASADLAALYLSVDMLDAAEHHAKAALGLPAPAGDETVAAMACQTLAGVAKARGDEAEGERWLDQAYARQSVFRQAVPACPFTTLVLVTRTNGNVPYKTLLPPARFDFATWYMEHARAGQAAALPPYAVVLNAIGEPDAAAASAEAVEAFLGVNTRPVLNRPERVQATARDRLGATLAGLVDVIMPITFRAPAADGAAERLLPLMQAYGLDFPVLVRPTGAHGGEGMMLAQAASDLPTALPAGDRFITGFHDYRSADGFYRKYRMIFVDRRPHAYHLAISPHWMVHHQSAGMAQDLARQAEELAFLHDPATAIGARALAAVAAIGERLDLDYGGIDFAVSAEGEVLVFEANATMLTHLEPPGSPFIAKNAFVQPIIDAFQAHVARLAAAPEAGRN